MSNRIPIKLLGCLLVLLALLVLNCSSQKLISSDISSVDTDTEGTVPKLTITPDYEAGQPETNIQFDIPMAGYVLLEVTNATGYHVKTLVDGEQEAGTHIVSWDFKNEDGGQISAGIYLYHLMASGYDIWSAFPFDIPIDLAGY